MNMYTNKDYPGVYIYIKYIEVYIEVYTYIEME